MLTLGALLITLGDACQALDGGAPVSVTIRNSLLFKDDWKKGYAEKILEK